MSTDATGTIERIDVDSSSGSERIVVVPPDHNSLLVHARGHSWVSIAMGDRPVVKTRSADPAIAFSLAPGEYAVRTDGAIESTSTASLRREPSLLERLRRGSPALLMLSSDAPNRHVVDGIAEIDADGRASCVIAVQKTDVRGVPLTGVENRDEIFIRTTGGLILDDAGTSRIRSIELRCGRASFRLLSDTMPKLVTVSVLSTDELTSSASIAIEFVCVRSISPTRPSTALIRDAFTWLNRFG